jgi:RNA polymerase primary sigma factor
MEQALTVEQEQELTRAIVEGRRARARLAARALPDAERRELERVVREAARARALLIAANQGLVRSVALRYRRPGLEVEDLVQEGNVGLLRAIERYDPSRGSRFATYAVWWVRQAILAALGSAGRMIRLPGRAERELVRLSRLAGQAPVGESGTGLEALAGAAGVDAAHAHELLTAAGPVLSLDSLLGGSELTLGEVIADPRADVDAALDRLAERQALAAALAALPDAHRRLLTLRYGLDGGPPRPLPEVAAQMGIPRDKARRLEGAALRLLRQRTPRDLAA